MPNIPTEAAIIKAWDSTDFSSPPFKAPFHLSTIGDEGHFAESTQFIANHGSHHAGRRMSKMQKEVQAFE